MNLPVLDPSLLHAVLQVRGLVAEEHITGAGGGVASCRMELPLNITHCMRNTYFTDADKENTTTMFQVYLRVDWLYVSQLTRLFPLMQLLASCQ